MLTPTLYRPAMGRVAANPGMPQQAIATDLPDWATASLVYDVDGVLLLEVLCWRPNRNPVPVISALCDGLSALGWGQTAKGALPWTRPDGVGCPGGWVTFVRRGHNV